MTTQEIAELLSLLDDARNLMKLVATAGDAIDNGCCEDRDGVMRLLDLGISIRIVSEIIVSKISEAAAILDKAAGMPMPGQRWRKW
jgi:hypothetical protein